LIRSQVRRIAIAALVAIVGLSGTTALGFWQYSRAHRDDISQRVLAAAAVPVRDLVAPESYVPEAVFGHAVEVAGTLRLDLALEACGHPQSGNAGCWFIAPVTPVDGGPATVAVLGWFPAEAYDGPVQGLRERGAQAIDAGGRLQPAELIDKGRAILRPSDTVTSINVNELAMRWSMPLLDGYVVLDTQIAGSPVNAPLILPPSGITWRNLIYAWQWWAFAAFVLFLLARYVIDVRSEAPTIPRIDAAAGTAREDRP
jgi:cytochrome oxidase assembly protein ShyY1